MHAAAITVEHPFSVCYKEVLPAVVHGENGELVCTSSETELLSCSFACANKVTDIIINHGLFETKYGGQTNVRLDLPGRGVGNDGSSQLATLAFITDRGP